jgi:hypothetical protein
MHQKAYLSGLLILSVVALGGCIQYQKTGAICPDFCCRLIALAPPVDSVAKNQWKWK